MDPKTKENLLAAFAGESQANRKYLAFAQKAEEEGYPEVAKLFRVAANSETVHALKHLAAVGGIGTTAENLKAALEGETYEFTDMYPGFIKTAEAANESEALKSFSNADAVEKEHGELYQKAILAPAEFKLGKVWVCQNCGHVHIGDEAPDECPVCKHPKKFFVEVA